MLSSLVHIGWNGDYPSEEENVQLVQHERCCAAFRFSSNTLFGKYSFKTTNLIARSVVCFCSVAGALDPNRNRREVPASVQSYLLSVYESAAEVLPEDFSMHSEALGNRVSADESDEANIERIHLNSASTVERLEAIARVGGVSSLPRRWLGQSAVTALFWMYRAVCIASLIIPASQATFLRVWHSGWSKVLRFRKGSTHSQCKRCWHLRREISSKTKPIVDKIQAAQDLRDHLQSQYADRVFYWACRESSRQSARDVAVGGDTLCIIIDSLDKSTHNLPLQ